MLRWLVLVLAAVTILACNRAPPSQNRATAAPAPVAAPGDAAMIAPASDGAAAVEKSGSRDGFVGSERCAECHVKKRDAWRSSWHARALARANRASVAGDFHDAHFAGSSSEAWMRTRGDAFVMRARDGGGAPADFGVDWVIGGKRMQDDVTVFPDGRWQVLPVYFQVTRKQWVDYTESKQGPLGPDHPFFWANFRRMANRECLDCHVTGLTVGYAPETRRWTTRFIDAGVACEDCHGPGAHHADSTAAADIFNPKQADAERALSICAQCHGPRNPLFPLLDARDRFQPGQKYGDFYDPIVVLIAGRRSNDFFADGRPRSSSFEYQAMLQSRCFRKGGAGCLTCHTAPHDAQRADELRAGGDENCRACHAAEFAAGRAHTHHDGKTAQCLGCHMPKVVSGVLDKFADHAIDVPSPANSARHDAANACAVCHAKIPNEKLAASLLRMWPNAGVRQARRARLADAFDEKTAAASAQPLLAVVADGDEAATLRGAAAIILAQRFPARVAAVVPLLQSSDALLRAKACEALAVAHARPAAELLAARGQDPSIFVRQEAALALAALGDARAEPALRALTDGKESARLVPPHYALGKMLARRGELPAARRELETVVRLMPYHADALGYLAQVLLQQGDATAARDRVEDALRMEPGNRVALTVREHLPPPR